MTLKTMKTKAQILEDVVSEKSLNDLEFLEGVVSELDEGWTTGAMCDTTGKCLVGAGAAVLGLNYGEVYSQRHLRLEEFNELIKDRGFIAAFDEKVRGMEFASAKRLVELVGREMGLSISYLDMVDDIPFRGDIVGAVTSFNDGGVPDYLALRRILTDKIKELRG